MSIDEHDTATRDRAEVDTDRYMIVSTDSHAGPKMAQLREYCPKEYLGQYDEFVKAWDKTKLMSFADGSPRGGGTPFTDLVKRRTAQTTDTDGVFDPHARLRDMDSDGLAAEVVYHGAMTPDVIPWQEEQYSRELQGVGVKMYNRWLADFCATAPERFIGAAHLPLWNIDESVKEVEWAANAGLKCLNFPAPNRAILAYNDPAYEPFWSICESTGLPLTTHGGSGDMPPYTGPEMWALYMSDLFFYSRRGLWYLIWSGAFERHPGLKMIFTEQRSEWVKDTLAHLDSIYYSEFHYWEKMIPRPPSDYFHQNCYIASSFMAKFEADCRHEIGVDRFMWGTDYPHYEGTWGYTDLSMRASFSHVPTEDLRLILGENAVKVFNLDRAKLRAIADRIGPSPVDIAKPIDPSELPEILGCSFRTRGTWS